MRLKSIAAVLIITMAVLQYRLWAGSGNLPEVWHLKEVIASQTTELERLKDRNRQLSAEVAVLKTNPTALEERARTELGMIKKGETYCLVVLPAKE